MFLSAGMFLDESLLKANHLRMVCIFRLLSYALHNPSELRTMGVGFSGVLFSYAIIESFHTLESSRSVFGLFSVPARIYPFILLVILQVSEESVFMHFCNSRFYDIFQVMIPGISFIGHLSGVLVGVLCVTGALKVCLPSTGT